MSTKFTAARRTRLAIAAMAIAGLPAAGFAGAALAQPHMTMDHAMHEHGDHGDRGGRVDRTEGRIAYLKAELKITAPQEAQWGAVADAMRKSAAAQRQLWDEMRNRGDQPMTAVERVTFRQRASELKAENDKAFATAFAALYVKMDDGQKKQADGLLSPRRHARL
ncbi:MAG: Spy/CpxP family protein refolding chaperone [Gemmatimonas sp.]